MILSATNYELVRGVLAGDTTATVAERAGLSPATVSRRIQRLYREVPGLDFAVYIIRALHQRQRAG